MSTGLLLETYSLASVLLPCVVFLVIQMIGKHRKGENCRAVYIIWVLLFVTYLWMVYTVTGTGLLEDALRTDTALFSGNINLRPFDSIGIGYILNIIMCMPLGFLLPLIWKEFRHPGKIVMTGALFSLMIEISQIITFRALDIDDLTANTLGAFLGYLAWKMFVRLFGEHLRRKDTAKWEAAAYILLAFLGRFFLYHPYWIYGRM